MSDGGFGGLKKHSDDSDAPFLRHASLFPADLHRVLVACSGGPDSMALLDAADRWRRETGRFLAVGHVDHGLRGAEGRRDARFVHGECRRRNVPCLVLKAPARSWARTRRKGLEEAARQVRYRALARAARRFHCTAVATGHNLDDQVETVFLNLLRGTGPSGLAGMAPDGPWPVDVAGTPPRLLRPLLSASRAQIRAHLQRQKLSWRNDATNDQPLFLRNRLRPVLRGWERLRPGFFSRVAQTARILRDEEAYWRARIRGTGRETGFRRKAWPRRLDLRRFLKYPMVEQRRRLRHLFGLAHFESLERVRAFAADRPPSKGGSRGPLDLPGVRVEKRDRFLLFRRRATDHRFRTGHGPPSVLPASRRGRPGTSPRRRRSRKVRPR